MMLQIKTTSQFDIPFGWEHHERCKLVRHLCSWSVVVLAVLEFMLSQLAHGRVKDPNAKCILFWVGHVKICVNLH